MWKNPQIILMAVSNPDLKALRVCHGGNSLNDNKCKLVLNDFLLCFNPVESLSVSQGGKSRG